MLKQISQRSVRSLTTLTDTKQVFIALGSNVGNRAVAIRTAIEQLRKLGSVHRTSFLYESAPMYVTDQPQFLNAACEFHTDLEPLILLHELKKIEVEMGRNLNGQRYGPRTIDLDILTFSNTIVNELDGKLVIPHPRIAERQFVLRPLCDISPTLEIESQSNGTKTVAEQLDILKQKEGDAGLARVTPFQTGRQIRWGEKTWLMGIINATPDSFSDGGRIRTVDAALRQAELFSMNGFDIVDIGGQSTRPGTEFISPHEELLRVTSMFEAVSREFPELILSCDTFNSIVAHEALLRGAEIINDVSAGALDNNMHELVKESGAATVQMHMRGTPQTMQSKAEYDSSDVVDAIGKELRNRLEIAQDVGIPRWSIIADCGVGFAKTAEHSEELLRRGAAFKQGCGGFPTLLGASRKSWMKGLLIHDGIEERDWATAGAIAASVALGGVDIVRVHSETLGDSMRACDRVCRGK